MNKYFLIVLVMFFSFLLTISSISAKSIKPLRGKIIVIDPGHGNKDPGTTYLDIYEKNLNLQISLKLKEILIENGANVIMTRDKDSDLASPTAMYRKKSDFDNRIKFINDSKVDLYLSIHLNFLNDSSYFGPQVFYKTEDIILAQKMQKVLNKQIIHSQVHL